MKTHSFKINGQEFRLRYNVRALLRFEEMQGKPISAVGEEGGLKEVIDLFYCGLLHEDKKLDYEDFLDRIDDVDIVAVQPHVIEAVQSALGEAKKKTLAKTKTTKK
jgi:hypothetical protein